MLGRERGEKKLRGFSGRRKFGHIGRAEVIYVYIAL